MNNIFDCKSIPDFLTQELSFRCTKNSRYSIRAFSRDLNISKSTLSEILRKESRLSLGTVNKISKNMSLTPMEHEYLIMLWQSYQQGLEKVARKNVKEYNSFAGINKLKKNQFNIMDKWYYLPILEALTNIQNITANDIAVSLRISELEITQAIKLLLMQGYIRKNDKGQYIKFSEHFKVEAKVKNKNIRDYHKKMLNLSASKIEIESIENRKFLTAMMGIRKKYLPAARKDLEIFLAKFLKKYGSQECSESLYITAFQFYELVGSASA